MKHLFKTSIIAALLLTAATAASAQTQYLGNQGEIIGTSDSRMAVTIQETNDHVVLQVTAIGVIRAQLFNFILVYQPNALVLTDNTFAYDIPQGLDPSDFGSPVIRMEPDFVSKYSTFSTQVENHQVITGGTAAGMNTINTLVRTTNPLPTAPMNMVTGQTLPVYKIFFRKRTAGVPLNTSDLGFFYNSSSPRTCSKWNYNGVNVSSNPLNAPDAYYANLNLFVYRSPSRVSTFDASSITASSATLNGNFIRGDFSPANNMVVSGYTSATNTGRINYDDILQYGFIYTKSNVELTMIEFKDSIYMNGTRYPFPAPVEIAAGTFIRGGITFYIKSKDNAAATRSVDFSENVTGLTLNDTYYYWSFAKYKFETSGTYTAVGGKKSFVPVSLFCGGDGSPAEPYKICTAEQLSEVRNYLNKEFILENDIDLNDYNGAIIKNAENVSAYWSLSQWSIGGGKLTSGLTQTGTAMFNYESGKNVYLEYECTPVVYAAYQVLLRNGSSNISLVVKPLTTSTMELTCYVGNTIVKATQTLTYGGGNPFTMRIDLNEDLLRVWVNKDTTDAPIFSVDKLPVEVGKFGFKNGNFFGGDSHGSHELSKINIHFSDNTNGWLPIGNSTTPFEGNFNGNRHVISGLWINRPTSDNNGLFGIVSNAAKIESLGVEIRSLSGAEVGIIGQDYVGGLVGRNRNAATITNCYVTGNISGRLYVGGLAGKNDFASITNCYAIGNIAASEDNVGGLVGINSQTANITNCYAAGKVTTGLAVTPAIGGFVGVSDASNITNCYFNQDLNPSLDAVGTIYSGTVTVTGKTTAEMKQQATFTPWDFATIWKICPNSTPLLRWQDVNCDDYNFCGGKGTDLNPYRICNAEQLNKVRNFLDKSFILMNDIDLKDFIDNNTVQDIKNNGWQPIGHNNPNSSANRFRGNFNGNGHKISGLWIDRPTTDYGGLFGVAENGTIENLGVEIAAKGVKGHIHVGGLMGYNASTIKNCYAVGDVTSTNVSVGGLVGNNNSGGTITNCYAVGNVTVTNNTAGGLAGINYTAITNCYAAGTVNGGSELGGLVGRNWNGAITNCFYDNLLHTGSGAGSDNNGQTVTGKSTADMKKQATFIPAGTGAGQWNFTAGTGIWTICENFSYPLFQWQNADCADYIFCGNGNGSPENPYHICDAEQLNQVRNYLDKSFILDNNIDIEAFSTATYGASGWLPIGTNVTQFSGNFNGAGHTISGLWCFITLPTDGVGLFGYINGAKIDSLGVEARMMNGVFVNNGAMAGVLAGSCFNSEISNCYAKGSLSGENYVGGLIGFSNNASVINNCYAQVNVYGESMVGGLIGDNVDGAVINCYAAGPVAGGPVAGGQNDYGAFIGVNVSGNVTNCYRDKTINPTLDAIGIDFNSQVVFDKTTAEMKTQSTFTAWDFDVPGVWKMCEHNIYPALQWQNIDCDIYPFCGGIGTAGNPYQICTAEQLNKVRNYLDKFFILNNDIDLTDFIEDFDNVQGWEPIGYLSAFLPTKFQGIFNGNGHIISGLWIERQDDNYIGLFGYTRSARIENLGVKIAEMKQVKGNIGVGGLVGTNEATIINNCYVDGPVSGNFNVGGLVGYNDLGSYIINCYVTGKVTATNYAGGVVGVNINANATIINCYAAASVSGNPRGGVVGGVTNNTNVSNCYFDKDISGATNGVGAFAIGGSATNIVGKTTAEMKQEATYTPAGTIFGQWNFTAGTGIWTICEGYSYPHFQWQNILCEHDYGLLFNVTDGKFYLDINDNRAYDAGIDIEYTAQATKWSYSGGILSLNGFEWETSAATALTIVNGALTIDIEGVNTFKSLHSGGGSNSYGVCGANPYALTIGGNGTLNAISGNTGGIYSSSGIYVNPSLTINGGTINAQGGASVNQSNGIYVHSNGPGGDAILTINGGNVNAVASVTAPTSYGVYVRMNVFFLAAKLNINSGSLTSQGNSQAIRVSSMDNLNTLATPAMHKWTKSANYNGSGSTSGIFPGGLAFSNSDVPKYAKIETIDKLTPTLTLSASPVNSLTLPGNITLTATLTGATDNSGKTIAFIVNSTQYDEITNASGVATFMVTNPNVGTYNFGASFAGDAQNNTAAATGISGYPVGLGAQVALTLNGLDNAYVYGNAPFNLSTSGGSGNGMVSYTSSAPAVASIAGNVVTILKAGTFIITATKAADANYAAASISSGSITVNEATPDVRLAATGGTNINDPIILTATVAKPNGSTGATPSGTVTFSEGAAILANNVTLNALGVATFTVNNPTGGSHTYKAEYSGQSGYYTGGSNTDTRVVGAAEQAALSITGIPAVITYGDAGFTLSTTGGNGTGAISFSAPANNGILNVTPQGAVTIIGAGKVAITVSKAADNSYNEKTATVDITVLQRNINLVTLATTGNRIHTGSQLQPTFTVSDGAIAITTGDYTNSYGANINAGTNAGSITLYGQGNYTGTKTVTFDIEKRPLTGATIILAAGPYIYTGNAIEPVVTNVVVDGITVPAVEYEVTYSGNTFVGTATVTVTAKATGNFSLSENKTFAIEPAQQEALTIIGLGNTYTYGEATFNLSTSGGNGSGMVSYMSSTPAVASIVGNVVTIHKAGTFTITATKAADANYNATSVTSGETTINEATPVVTLTGADVNYGQNVTITATVAAPAGSTGAIPSGTVTFYEGLTELATDVLLVNGEASYTTTALPVAGNHSYSAEYSGQTDYYTTASGMKSVGVGMSNQAALNITGKPAVITYGDAGFTLSTTGGSGTGAVSFSAPANNGILNVTSGGTVTITGAGTVTITATKAGDNNYNTATANLNITVDKRNINLVTVSVTGNRVYTGSQLQPTFNVFDGAIAIITGDYTNSYGANINVGTNAGSITLYGQGNYTGTKTVMFDITAKSVTVDWANTTLTYNGLAQKPTANITGVGTDGSITLDVSGEQTNVGAGYTATASFNPDNENYTLTNNPTNFEITKRQITIKAKDETIDYGQTPVLAYEITEGNLVNSDKLTGALAVDNLEVGKHNITQGTLTAGDNYNITYVFAILTVLSVDVSVSEITIDGETADRTGNNFNILAQCGANSVEISVATDPLATVTINGVPQNPRSVNLTNYGANVITIIVKAQNGDTETYTLTVDKPITADIAFYDRFAGVLIVPVQVEGIGAVNTVEWYLNGVRLDRDPAKGYIEMKEAGSYYALINGTIRTCEVVQTSYAASSISVYPNPTAGAVNVEYEQNIDQIQVFDNFGKLILTPTEKSFDISHLPQGVYLIKINGETVKIIRK
ncbi:MAG: Ig-like domain repeat protein [Dysgonamonadaceae bacterium]|jgi:uncharacterized protein YaiE (UPF0345 family)|nr:Ig-like domain repeat protein [Dysgonamonadaceae bacterium]